MWTTGVFFLPLDVIVKQRLERAKKIIDVCEEKLHKILQNANRIESPHGGTGNVTIVVHGSNCGKQCAPYVWSNCEVFQYHWVVNQNPKAHIFVTMQEATSPSLMSNYGKRRNESLCGLPRTPENPKVFRLCSHVTSVIVSCHPYYVILVSVLPIYCAILPK